MSGIQSIQGDPTLAQLLAIQASSRSAAPQASLPSQATPSTSAGSTDSLSISSAALQALQGLGPDPAQSLPQGHPTAKGHGHHHHHRGGVQVATETPTQSGTPIELAQLDPVGNSRLQKG